MTTLSKTTLASALLGAATLAAVALGTATAFAQSGPAPVPEFENEKCFGIVKAGKNDCQFSSGSCAGTATADSLPDTWVYLPAGTCDKIIGASLTPLT